MTTTNLPEKRPQFVKPIIETIRTPAQYEGMATMLRGVKAYKERVTTFFEPHKRRAREAWQGLVDEEKKALAPADEAEKEIKAELIRYDTEQEELRKAEERRLAEEARVREEQRRLDEAAALEAEGKRTGNDDLVFQAEDLLQQPIETPAVQLASRTPHVSGLSFKETWSAKVTDFKKLVKWVAKNPKDTNLLLPNQPALNQMAKARRENLKIDGVQAVSNKGAASRS